jgi:hypothetical protein
MRHRRNDRSREEEHRRRRHKSKTSDGDDDGDSTSSSSSSGEDGPDVKRSVITGKRIRMHIDKTEDDLVRDKARKDILKFMNQSL